ncbi:hypothetical protein D3878_18485 [Noviherbaspirillum sedimenti]|uniref:Uncharacterized protein n=1 Tax=Noviherbaspirillum sedimenti TaxID=2320865 RepID=A0A3A3G9S1_9BURK|nr:hypothetical protein D3878_18485 [Noviherbaspirillum sedimenti]
MLQIKMGEIAHSLSIENRDCRHHDISGQDKWINLPPRHALPGLMNLFGIQAAAALTLAAYTSASQNRDMPINWQGQQFYCNIKKMQDELF